MKRIVAGILCLLMMLSAFSCSSDKETETKMQTAASEEEEIVSLPKSEAETKEQTESPETVDKGPAVYDKVSYPLTPERVAAIPIANNSMSSDELRDICVDYVRLSVSFQWVPNQSFDYKANQGGGTPVHFEEGKLHGGIPYVNTASGNLYRLLDFYDVETGIMDVKWLAKNTDFFGSACSGTTGWGWARVINSAETGWTATLNAAHGLVPVGPYEYDESIKVYGQGDDPDCKDIARKNGKQVMFESYAMSRKADCFVNNGHVRMNGADPVVVRNADGTIDGKKSYIVQVEQGLFTTGAYHKRVSADGIEYVIQGNEGKMGDGSDFYYTFETLYSTGYLPHTFKEFHGLDPVEPAEVNIPHTGETATDQSFAKGNLTCNYPISDVFVNIKDENGKVVLPYVKRTGTHFIRAISLAKCVPISYLPQYMDGKHTIEITVQTGTGALVEAYSGTLVPRS